MIHTPTPPSPPQNHLQLLDTSAVGVKREKLYQLDEHLACAVAGITADANILVNTCRLHAQRYALQYQEPIPVEQLVRALCDTKQGYTQYGGLRPFGVSLLYAGWDATRGFQLYQSDPSGNFGGWKAACIGANHQAATNALQGDWRDDLTLDEAVRLVLKVMGKTMDSTALTPEKVELATLSRDEATGLVEYRVLGAEELTPVLTSVNLDQAREREARA